MRIVREGWPFILGCLIASDLFLAGAIVLKSGVLVGIAVICFVATAFCVYFFRDPVAGDSRGRAPASCPRRTGKSWRSSKGKMPIAAEPVWILRIFLSVFEPHLQRSPVAGTVRAIQLQEGEISGRPRSRKPRLKMSRTGSRSSRIQGRRPWWSPRSPVSSRGGSSAG